jgi:CRISPR-associated protein Cmr6
MPVAAVPRYLQADDPQFFLSAPPGHRFLLYFPVWGYDAEREQVVWQTRDKVRKYKRERGELRFDKWTELENDQFACTIAACSTPPYEEETPRAWRPQKDSGLKPWVPLMDALLVRQRAAFAARADAQAGLRLQATAIAPFTTGLGNEHPLENGFAFLNPYGLPYLPGSGVKGVIRRAAQELACGDWGECRGWSEEMRYSIEIGTGKDKRKLPLSMLDVLFGREPQSGEGDHVRGALTFWDVIPQIAGGSLMVEIMTPHQSHYYQQKGERKTGDSTNPHDSGQPAPISFLTVPPESFFVFHVVCDTAHQARLAPDLAETGDDGRPRWQKLIEAAFEHAFAWLGFGAKTAVGYGAMTIEPRRPSGSGHAAAAPVSVGQNETWLKAELKWEKGKQELTAVNKEKKIGAFSESGKGKSLFDQLPEDARKKLANGKDVQVDIEVAPAGGGRWKIVAVKGH